MSTSHKQKVDLHVHSPGSSDFKGDKSRQGYIDLLQAYVDAGVDAIAITDHNTIRGFNDFRRYEEDTRIAFRLMSDRRDAAGSLTGLKTEVDNLDRVTVIGGVEITAYPNIHVILLFDDSVIGRADSFLRLDLDLGSAVDRGDPEPTTKDSVIVLLDKADAAFGDKYLCILPHIDSSKGAWREMSGSARAQLFRDSRVRAVQFLNPDTRKQLETLFRAREYRRHTPLAFIQASDYHGEPNLEPASQHVVLSVEGKCDFEQVRQALDDPNSIVCSHEFVEEDLKEYLEGKSVISFRFENKLELTESNRAEFASSLCAIFNTPGSVLKLDLANISAGKQIGPDVISQIVLEGTQDIDPGLGIKFGIRQFNQSESRQCYCVTAASVPTLQLLNNKCVVVRGGKTDAATALEIEEIVFRRFYDRRGLAKQNELEFASYRITMAANSFPAMPLAGKIDKSLAVSSTGRFLYKMEWPNYPSAIEEIGGPINGFESGNVAVLKPSTVLKGGRIADESSYFRVLVPLFRTDIATAEDDVLLKANSLVVFADGGVCFVPTECAIYTPQPIFALRLNDDATELKESERQLILGLTCWFKSNLVLWYLTSVHHTDDLASLFGRRLLLPMPTSHEFICSLAKYGEQIMQAEKKVLNSTSSQRSQALEPSKLSAMLEAHNNKILSTLVEIEKEVLIHFKVTRDEAREIYRSLRSLGLYDYGISLQLDDFLDSLER